MFIATALVVTSACAETADELDACSPNHRETFKEYGKNILSCQPRELMVSGMCVRLRGGERWRFGPRASRSVVSDSW